MYVENHQKNDEEKKEDGKMKPKLTKNEYMHRFQETVTQSKRETDDLEDYMMQQFDRLNQLTSTVSPNNFWETLPKVLGIDAKLILIAELIRYDEFSINEILRIIETDYRTYLKELCGNDLSVGTNNSIVFHVL